MVPRYLFSALGDVADAVRASVAFLESVENGLASEGVRNAVQDVCAAIPPGIPTIPIPITVEFPSRDIACGKKTPGLSLAFGGATLRRGGGGAQATLEILCLDGRSAKLVGEPVFSGELYDTFDCNYDGRLAPLLSRPCATAQAGSPTLGKSGGVYESIVERIGRVVVEPIEWRW